MFREQMSDFARGDRLRRLREDRHLSQEDAAHEISVSVKTLRSWEKGGKIRWENAKRAAAFYSVEAESLVSRELQDTPLAPVNGEVTQLDRIETMLAEILDRLGAQKVKRAASAAGQASRPTRQRASKAQAAKGKKAATG